MLPFEKTPGAPMRVDVRVMLRNDDDQTFVGIGIIWLLKGIEQHNSISRAAREMNLSYPKALRIIKNLENGLGNQIVICHKGGNERGGAEITPLGRDFIRRFDRMQERIQRFASSAFKKDFAKSLLVAGRSK
jgi:molybdate transport system regulatory protein